MIHPALGIFSVIAVLSALIFAVAKIRKKHSLHPELGRKIVHVVMGLVSLSFPLLFKSSWPVFLLAFLAGIFLMGPRLARPLKKLYGGALHGIQRESLGDICFPLSVAVIFHLALAEKNFILYYVPLLILTLADAVSALVGTKYGFTTFSTSEGHKSVEGSTAFFTVAFLSAHVPLLLFTETGRAESLLMAFNVGLLVMLLEAIAWKGLDNIFIPLGGFIILRSFTEMNAQDLLLRLIVIIAIVVFVLLWRRHTTLNDSALLGAALVLFASWSLGGWKWFVAPAALLATHVFLFPIPEKDRGTHSVIGVMAVTGPGLFWLFVANLQNRPDLLTPFNISFGVNLAIIGVAWLFHKNSKSTPARLIILGTIKGWLLYLTVQLVVAYNPASIAKAALIPLLCIAAGATAYYATHPKKTGFAMSTYHWARQTVVALSASYAGYAILNAMGAPL